MLRRRRRAPAPAAPPDWGNLEPRCRSAVEAAVASRAQFQALVAQTRPGAVRDRLAGLGDRIDAGVVAAQSIAERASAATRTLQGLDLERAQDRLKDARRRLAQARGSGADTAALAAEVDLVAEQHAALNQLANAIDESAERLRLLDLRLQAAVARAAQIALRPDAAEQLGTVETELAAVTDELTALRAGLDAVGG